jgi:hypothetical protein
VGVARTAGGERPTVDRSIARGDRVFLLRQATGRGIIASGYAVGWVVAGPPLLPA